MSIEGHTFKTLVGNFTHIFLFLPSLLKLISLSAWASVSSSQRRSLRWTRYNHCLLILCLFTTLSWNTRVTLTNATGCPFPLPSILNGVNKGEPFSPQPSLTLVRSHRRVGNAQVLRWSNECSGPLTVRQGLCIAATPLARRDFGVRARW